MSNNTKVIRGEIYYVDRTHKADEDGCVIRPGRPGIIVSNDANNRSSEIVEIVYLTTQPKINLPTHCTIVSAARTSTAICEQIVTVSKDRLSNYIGLCTENEMENIDRCLAISLGLTLEAEPAESVEQDEDEYDEDGEIDDERIDELYNTIRHMEKELLKAHTREEIYQQMYNDLLEKFTE